MTEPFEVIARRAYVLWEREGRPEGRDQEHWFRAEAESEASPVPGDADTAATAMPEARAPEAAAPATASPKAAAPSRTGRPVRVSPGPAGSG